VWVILIVHAHDMNDHPINDLSLTIHLGVEGSGFSELGVQELVKGTSAQGRCVACW